MKQLTALILALILAFSLVGCGIKPSETSDSQSPTDPTAATSDTEPDYHDKTEPTDNTKVAENTEGLGDSSQLAITFDVDPNYQYGNRQKQFSGNFYQLGNEVVFSYDNGTRTRLYSYNLETGEVRRYCPDPVCDHKPCQSGIPYHFLEVYDGKLYGTVSNKPSRLNVVDGTQVATATNAKVTFTFHYDGKLYVQTANGDLAVLEEGQDTPQVILANCNLNSGAVFGPYLYTIKNYYTSRTIVRIDLTADTPVLETLVHNALGIADGQHIYYVNHETYQLYRCNMDGSNPQLLLEQQVMPISINFDNNYVYYRLLTDPTDKGPDAFDIYRFPKNDPTKTEKIVTLDKPVYQVFTVPGSDKLFVTVIDGNQDKDSDIYVMGTDGSNPTLLEIPE